MTDFAFVVYGDPVPQGSARSFIPKGWTRPIVTDSNAKLKPWRQAVMAGAVETRLRAQTSALTGPVELTVTFYVPRPKSAKKIAQPTKRPDLSKQLRALEDALTGVLFEDDAQVTTAIARKVYAGGHEDFGERFGQAPIPRAEVRVRPDPGGFVSLVRSARPVTVVTNGVA